MKVAMMKSIQSIDHPLCDSMAFDRPLDSPEPHTGQTVVLGSDQGARPNDTCPFSLEDSTGLNSVEECENGTIWTRKDTQQDGAS